MEMYMKYLGGKFGWRESLTEEKVLVKTLQNGRTFWKNIFFPWIFLILIQRKHSLSFVLCDFITVNFWLIFLE